MLSKMKERFYSDNPIIRKDMVYHLAWLLLLTQLALWPFSFQMNEMGKFIAGLIFYNGIILFFLLVYLVIKA